MNWQNSIFKYCVSRKKLHVHIKSIIEDLKVQYCKKKKDETGNKYKKNNNYSVEKFINS